MNDSAVEEVYGGVKAPVVYGHGSLAAEIMAWVVERPPHKNYSANALILKIQIQTTGLCEGGQGTCFQR